MSELDLRALEANFANWKSDRMPNADDGRAFERYTIELILKSADLTDDEYASGQLGSKDDGGVDAMFFFVNTTLIDEETDVPDPAMTADLHIIAATMRGGFGEIAVGRLHHFADDLLTYSRPPEKLAAYNTATQEAIRRFREAFDEISGSLPVLNVTFHYATKADTPPNAKVLAAVDKLKQYVKTQLSAANVQFEFWDCSRLLQSARTAPVKEYGIRCAQTFPMAGRATVCLVKLGDLAAFLTDDNGKPRRGVLEPNVRDYAGRRNPVNKDIRATLDTSNDEEFWWFNNGITLLATDFSFRLDQIIVERPQIVNGLQTCHEIFEHFKAEPDRDDKRHVLIRVIVPPDEATRNRITKATNYQTEVQPISLHALEPLHMDIEDRLKRYDLYYDRRRGEYRNQRKPIQQIVSILDLARAVIAILLARPDDARARPQSFLKNDAQYLDVFNAGYNRDVYAVVILIDRAVWKYLSTKGDILAPPEIRRDLRHYVSLYVACRLAGRSNPTTADLVALKSRVVGGIDEKDIETAFEVISIVYTHLGATDRVAKSVEMREAVLAEIRAQIG